MFFKNTEEIFQRLRFNAIQNLDNYKEDSGIKSYVGNIAIGDGSCSYTYTDIFNNYYNPSGIRTISGLETMTSSFSNEFRIVKYIGEEYIELKDSSIIIRILKEVSEKLKEDKFRSFCNIDKDIRIKINFNKVVYEYATWKEIHNGSSVITERIDKLKDESVGLYGQIWTCKFINMSI